MKLSHLLFILLLIHGFAFCQPRDLHISWNGDNTATTMGVTWVDDQQKGNVVQYGTSAEKLNQTVPATTLYSDYLKAFVNKTTIQHLEPASYYFYRVGSATKGWSKVYRFRTGPVQGSSAEIVVGLWSDTQNNTGNVNFERTDSIVNQMSKNAYYFTIHTGDIVENGSVVNSWKNLFNVTQPINANSPFMSVSGNHDVVNDTTSASFQKPFPIFHELMNLPHDQLNYAYDYGNTHFIAINSGYAQGAEKVGKVLFAPGSAEYQWLENDLITARKNKNVQWIILYSHYPLYAYGVSHIVTWQNHIKPLVDKYKVDLCIAGHRHVYERHKAVRNTSIFEQVDMHVYNKPKGTVYVNNGSCGGSAQGVGGWNLPTMVFTPKEKIYTYAIMTIKGNMINYHVYDKTGKEVDYFKIIK